ncbi:LANO_0F15434g1_1 [Lachancea nothofagi CBS 11611]|uniref:LANO_0F15434g1_1 n=1 Tax=Lachancea nothofagi CBS 11611 TaxID=1266666 RepID=A0A1G4KCL6_9SACH|nr:LANO_0F15434g1_1 [Lachancea nothofagi CBS 11611]
MRNEPPLGNKIFNSWHNPTLHCRNAHSNVSLSSFSPPLPPPLPPPLLRLFLGNCHVCRLWPRPSRVIPRPPRVFLYLPYGPPRYPLRRATRSLLVNRPSPFVILTRRLSVRITRRSPRHNWRLYVQSELTFTRYHAALLSTKIHSSQSCTHVARIPLALQIQNPTNRTVQNR